MLLVAVDIQAVRGSERVVREAFQRSRTEALANPECLAFDIYEAADDARRLLILERWTDAEHHRAFFDAVTQRPGFADFRAHLDGDPAIRRFHSAGLER